MKKLTASTLVLFTLFIVKAQKVIDLWPEGAPGQNGLTEIALSDGTFCWVTDPKLEFFLPEPSLADGRAVVICPGGSYMGLAMNHEGRDVARWLAERGIAGIVLKYRMPGGKGDIPLSDVGKAIRTVRENASAWNIDQSRVGVMGFSAGGHLASMAITELHGSEGRPDFGILVYPVISMKDELTHFESRKNLTGADSYRDDLSRFSSETRVTASAPPVLIFYSADDDIVDVRNGTAFFDACIAAGVPAEMHVYPTGGHGWGWSEEFRWGSEMKSVVGRWLYER
ncbi:MAG: alpha/beta hydrolase [Rikenellaceae bacterium]|nr:alpha/beta hydrolase [Rikenellaceae bacterium]